jgi:transposase
MSGGAIAKKYRVGRQTIIRALSSAWPEHGKQLPPRVSKLDPFKPVIEEILKSRPGRAAQQRHTVTRIWHRLMDEYRMADVSYPVVRAYVAERRRRSGRRPGRGPAEAFVPRSHRPGDEAQADFGEVVVRLAGKMSAASCSAGGCSAYPEHAVRPTRHTLIVAIQRWENRRLGHYVTLRSS